MGVSLSSKLTSIQTNQIVSEVDTLLRSTHVRISWWAKRMVSIDGYAGEVEINALAEKYLQAPQFRADQDASLQERVACYDLWGKVQDLYKKSHVELGKTWIYWFLTSLCEFRPWCRVCAGDPMAIIEEWELGSTKNSIFEFTPEKFRQLWPTSKPIKESTFFSDNGLAPINRWTATKEMVDQAIQKTALGTKVHTKV